jgi:hypothetical protein
VYEYEVGIFQKLEKCCWPEKIGKHGKSVAGSLIVKKHIDFNLFKSWNLTKKEVLGS